MDISIKVKETAKAAGLRLQDVADRLGVSYMQFYRYLNGNITLSNLCRIAEALGTTPAELLQESPGPARTTARPDRSQETNGPGPRPGDEPGTIQARKAEILFTCPGCRQSFRITAEQVEQDDQDSRDDDRNQE